MKVGEGCVAIAYEHGDLQGWHAFFPAGEYSGEAFTKDGAKINDLSSIVVVAGSMEDAKAAHNAIEEDHRQAIKPI